MTHTELLAMPLHDTKHIGRWTSVQRVVGGWVYWYNDDISSSGVFVPEQSDKPAYTEEEE